MTTPPLLTGQVARQAGVSEQTIREWTNTGKLPALKTVTGMRLYDPLAVEAFLRARLVRATEDRQLVAAR